MRRTAIVLVLAAAGSALALGPDAPASPTRPPLVVLSIDGLRPTDVLQAAQHGLRVPHLRRLVADGAHASGVVGVLPTVTYPSHVTLVTGVSPARHGILANQPFDPMARNMGGWYWYAEDIGCQRCGTLPRTRA